MTRGSSTRGEGAAFGPNHPVPSLSGWFGPVPRFRLEAHGLALTTIFDHDTERLDGSRADPIVGYPPRIVRTPRVLSPIVGSFFRLHSPYRSPSAALRLGIAALSLISLVTVVVVSRQGLVHRGTCDGTSTFSTSV